MGEETSQTLFYGSFLLNYCFGSCLLPPPHVSKWTRVLPTFAFCRHLSSWVVSSRGRGHVYILQDFQKYLLYREEGRFFFPNQPAREKNAFAKKPTRLLPVLRLGDPACCLTQGTEASWKLGSTEMTSNQGCPGDCGSVLESAMGLRVRCWWPCQEEGRASSGSLSLGRSNSAWSVD